MTKTPLKSLHLTSACDLAEIVQPHCDGPKAADGTELVAEFKKLDLETLTALLIALSASPKAGRAPFDYSAEEVGLRRALGG